MEMMGGLPDIPQQDPNALPPGPIIPGMVGGPMPGMPGGSMAGPEIPPPMPPLGGTMAGGVNEIVPMTDPGSGASGFFIPSDTFGKLMQTLISNNGMEGDSIEMMEEHEEMESPEEEMVEEKAKKKEFPPKKGKNPEKKEEKGNKPPFKK